MSDLVFNKVSKFLPVWLRTPFFVIICIAVLVGLISEIYSNFSKKESQVPPPVSNNVNIGGDNNGQIIQTITQVATIATYEWSNQSSWVNSFLGDPKKVILAFKKTGGDNPKKVCLFVHADQEIINLEISGDDTYITAQDVKPVVSTEGGSYLARSCFSIALSDLIFLATFKEVPKIIYKAELFVPKADN